MSVQARLDPQMKELIIVYLKRRLDDLTTIEKAIQAMDFTKVAFIGHNIKGTGPGYGLDQLESIGKGLEHAANEKDAAAVRKVLEDFKHFVENLEVTYEE